MLTPDLPYPKKQQQQPEKILRLFNISKFIFKMSGVHFKTLELSSIYLMFGKLNEMYVIFQNNLQNQTLIFLC